MCEQKDVQKPEESASQVERLVRAEGIIKDIWKMFYGQNMELTNWHLNGDTEPIDNFFEENDWVLDEPVYHKKP